MIHLEVLKSHDPNALGLYPFEFDKIHIGRSKKNDLIFFEKQLPLQFLTLEIIKGQLVVRNNINSLSFYLNGKKVNGLLKLNLGDTLSFGSQEVKVVAFKQVLAEEDLSQDFERFSEKSSELQFALDFIEDVLLKMEEDKHV